jgi:hypothetical protein
MPTGPSDVTSESSEAALASVHSSQASSDLPKLPPVMLTPGQEAIQILLKGVRFVAEVPKQGDPPGKPALWTPQPSVCTIFTPLPMAQQKLGETFSCSQ